jgi:hypothetical protein
MFRYVLYLFYINLRVNGHDSKWEKWQLWLAGTTGILRHVLTLQIFVENSDTLHSIHQKCRLCVIPEQTDSDQFQNC